MDPTATMSNEQPDIEDEDEQDGLAWEQERQQKIVSDVARQFINISQVPHFQYI